MANYWYYNKDGKLYSSNEAKLWLAKDNCMHFGNLPQHVKDLNGLLPLTVKHEWVGLTADEYAELAEEYGSFPINQIEAKLKEKNNG
jgi:hypothetical protein